MITAGCGVGAGRVVGHMSRHRRAGSAGLLLPALLTLIAACAAVLGLGGAGTGPAVGRPAGAVGQAGAASTAVPGRPSVVREVRDASVRRAMRDEGSVTTRSARIGSAA